MSVATTGPDAPANYDLRLDGGASRSIEANGTASFTAVSAGAHAVHLLAAPTNCTVAGSNPRTTTVVAGQTVAVNFDVACVPLTGTLEVTTLTTGDDSDPDGYRVSIDGEVGLDLGINAQLEAQTLPVGEHQVELTDVATNCMVMDENPRPVQIAADAAVTTTFEIACSATTGMIEVTTATGGDDIDADGYTVELDGMSSQSVEANGTATFTGVPEGPHSLTLSGVAANCAVTSDNPATSTVVAGEVDNVAFSVTCTGMAPVAIVDAYATFESTPLSIAAPGLVANDLDPDGDSFLVSNFTQPSNGTLTSVVTNGAFTYVPDPGFTGTDQFTYRLRESATNVFSESVTVIIEVLPDPNRPPLGQPDFYGMLQGGTLSIAAPGLVTNDLDLDGDSFLLSNFTQPSSGTLTSVVTNGAFTYVPDPGFAGTDQFTYRLRETATNVFSEFATVTVEVLAPGDGAPVAIVDAYATFESTPLSIAAPGLVANDLDPDGDSFLVSNFTQPSNGTLTSVVTNGAFTYVPDPGFTGTDQFTYRLRESATNVFSESVTVIIEVLPDPNRPPLGQPDFYGMLQGGTLSIAAPGLMTNDLDLDGDSFRLSNFTQPSSGTLTSVVTNGAFTYVPDPGFAGTDQFTYRLRETATNVFSEFATVTVTVLAPPNP